MGHVAFSYHPRVAGPVTGAWVSTDRPTFEIRWSSGLDRDGPSTTDARLDVTLVSYGFAESVVPLAAAVAQHARVQLILPDGQAARAQAVDGVADTFMFPKPRLRQPVRQAALALKVARRIAAFAPGVIHLQQGHLWFNLLLPYLKAYPLVLTVHDARPHPGDRATTKTPQFVFDFGYRRADQFIVHAEHVKQQLTTQWHYPVDDIHVIPLAFPDVPSQSPALEGDRTYTILFFGRIWPYKGLEYLIDAEPHVADQLSAFRIVIAGTGEPFDRYQRMMANPDRFAVEYAFIPDERREELFAQADVVVLPYIEATQTGVVPLAYRRGIPVIATDVGGLPEVVEDGRTGLLVPPRDPRALASAIVTLADPGRRREMGRHARRFFEQHFGLGAIGSRSMAVYRRAAQRSHR
jgi:glycosyltransferase involved in cell wall biosynthesis